MTKRTIDVSTPTQHRLNTDSTPAAVVAGAPLKRLICIVLAALAAAGGATAQVKLEADTLECHIIGFSAGVLMPGTGWSSAGYEGIGMRDLYQGPFLDFALECDYKYKSGLMVTLDGDLWFGYNSDNLRGREERMPIYGQSGILYSWGGYDAAVTAYNRSLAARVGVARLIPCIKGNPNSGVLLGLKGGWMMQKTVFTQDMNESPAPQINGPYAHLYDHLRNGAILTESIGFAFMSNYSTYVNFKLSIDISQCIGWSSRNYQIDNLAGLNGQEQGSFFDLMYGLRLTWMFPLMGKTTYDYYYY